MIRPTAIITASSRCPTRPIPSRCGSTTRSTILLVVIGYNMAPVVRGAGSAIFLHVARPDFSPTAGCIAVEKSVLVSLLPLLGPASMLTIRI